MKIDSGRLVPDTILHGGKIVTVDARSSVAEAVAIADDRIVAVGSDREVRALAGRGTREVDLRGTSVIPGLIDNHTHPMMAGFEAAEVGAKVDVATARSIPEILARIRDAVRDAKPGEWVTTSCLYRGGIEDGRFPNRHDLDTVAPDNPVYIADGGRNVIVNTLALEMAGIGPSTPDPDGTDELSEGHIVRDEEGVPTGHLIVGAGDLARRAWWVRLGQEPQLWDLLQYDRETSKRAVVAQMRTLNAAGITGTRDMGTSVWDLDAYVEVARDGDATVRMDLLLGLPMQHWSIERITETLRAYFGPRQGFGNEWVRIGGLKLVAQNYGYWTTTPRKLDHVIREGNRLGWRFAIHGTPGDLGDDITVILDALEAADAESPLAGKRWSYEHAFGLINPVHHERLRKLGVIIAANPMLAYFGAGRAMEMHKTMEALKLVAHDSDLTPLEHTVREWGQPVRSWLDAGLLVTGGTDTPAIPYDLQRPLLGLWTTFSQDTLAGELMPEEKVSRMEALRIWTANNAYATFEEHLKGSIEPGKLADLVILSGDVLDVPDSEFLDLRVLETIVGGRTVHEHSAATV
ncbi:amidohydrolase [Pseudonocardia yunnanensis]|uniref:Amidohydrolase n=1 Tax=Pseudonocardia yunnanensis TaxID=58107 RepID=A0ABW4FAA0_9PSEU